MRKEKIVARWFTVLKACRNKLQPVDYRLNKIKRHDQVFFVFRGLCKAIHPLRKKFSFPYLNKEQVVLSLCFFISKLWNHHALLTLQERARVSLQIYQVCDQIMILTVSCSEFRSFFTLKKWGNEECAKLDMHKACDLVFLWSLLILHGFERIWLCTCFSLESTNALRMLIKFFSTPNSCHAVSRKWGEESLLEFEVSEEERSNYS